MGGRDRSDTRGESQSNATMKRTYQEVGIEIFFRYLSGVCREEYLDKT